MDTSPEKYCQALACVYQTMMNEMKSSIPIWEDFAVKCTKLQSALKVSLLALGAFLDAFQKLADLSMNSKGGSRELGSSLTRLCMRQRTVEAKLKLMSTSLVDQLANPVLEKVEEWKRNAVAIDKERTRDYKKARQEVKRASMDTLRMQKKVRKTSGAGIASSGPGSTAAISGNARSFSNAPMGTLPRDGGAVAQAQLEYAMQDVCARWAALQEAEQCSLRKVMREERARFCFFITCFKPIIDQEVSLLSEMTCFQEIAEKLTQQAADVNTLPGECEQLLNDLRDSPELLLKSFSQSQSSLSLSQVQLHAGAALTTNADSVSLGSASDTHSPSAGSSSASVSACADSNSNPNLLAGAPNETAVTNLESTNERHVHTNSHAALPPMRRESIASVGSETLLRRASQKNGPQHATTALHHCATDCSSNLLHASGVSMSTNSLASNISRSSCSSAGATGHAQHATLNSLPKSALTGVSSSSAASALLCVAAATRNAAAAKTTSQDSGFISQDTLYAACSGGRVIPPNTGAGAQGGRDKRASTQAQAEDGIVWMQKDDSPESALETFENYIGQVARQLGDMADDLPPSRSDSPSHGSSASPVSTWTNWPEQPGYFDPKVLNAQLQARPYTVSAPGASGTRKLHHSRPPLTDKMFEPPASLASETPCADACASAPDAKPAKVPPPVPTKCPALHENSQCHYAAPAPFGAQQTRNTITEDSFECALQNSFNADDPECTLIKCPVVADEDFPAPPSADILQRIAADCVQVQQVHTHVLQRGDTVDMLPLPPPPSDYADPMRPQSPPPTNSTASATYAPPTVPTPGVVRSLASESSPISKLIQQLSAKGDRSRNDDHSSAMEQPVYAAVNSGQPLYSASNAEQVYAAPANSTATMRQSRPEQCEYAQTGVRHSSRTRPAPPQRRSSVQIGSAAQLTAPPSAPIRPLPGNKSQYQSPPSSAGVEYRGLPLGMASQSTLPAVPNWNGTGVRQLSMTAGGQSRIGVMQVVAMPVDIQPSSGSLTSQAPLAVPIPAVRMSLGGIATCPPELNEHAGAILRQIKNGVSLRHCSASLINDKSRPLLRF